MIWDLQRAMIELMFHVCVIVGPNFMDFKRVAIHTPVIT